MGGALADRHGGKPILAIGALAWSIFTLIIPMASGAGLFWVVLARIGLGLGEGVAVPSVHAMIGTWAPPSERSKAVATVTVFGYSGSVIALPISSSLVVSSWGWRSIFWLFGMLGLLWSIAWQIWGASDPTSCKWITEHEKHWILQQQQLDQLPNDGLHRLATSGSNASDDALEYLDQTRTIGENGAPVTYQSLQQDIASRPSEDGENEIQASCSSIQSSSEENGLVFRADASTAVAQNQRQQSRWQAFRNKIRSKTAAEGRNLTYPKKEPVPWKELLMRREVWAIILSQTSARLDIMQFCLQHYKVLWDYSRDIWGTRPHRTGIGRHSQFDVRAKQLEALHDFCPQHAGFIFSLGNTAGSIPALIGVYIVGVLLDAAGALRWVVIWGSVCLFYVVGTPDMTQPLKFGRFSVVA
ncbi:hypothetical protein BGX27_001506 [Mortierella sp. AM989]|nr:hypothetical protein BGX27_001506 [Mortierella sp. AM989]